MRTSPWGPSTIVNGADCSTARAAGESQRRPMSRLAAYTVFIALVTACRLAMWPTSRLPLSESATIDGVVL